MRISALAWRKLYEKLSFLSCTCQKGSDRKECYVFLVKKSPHALRSLKKIGGLPGAFVAEQSEALRRLDARYSEQGSSWTIVL